MEKYAFFGGSFNPPTYAHLEIAKIALAYLNLSKVFFVPVGNNYNKADLLDEKVRYEMLRLMCENEGNIYVENIELNRKKALRAHQALEEIDKKYNTSENYYIMGADNFVRLPNWDEAEEMLKKYNFIVFKRGEIDLEEQINDDEFDYIYYTYGLEHYHDMPLIEPLEYKEVKKVRDFVIAIDTSGSCAGEVVQKFLDKTYSIFSQQENFFRKINLHIIQCDAAIQSDVKITNKQEFADYMKDLEFRGFGGTDFRPVFEYVNQLIEHNEFDDLKGLIYFTDGNGIYPKKRPPYETAFVFVDDDEFDYEVPSWAMKLVLETSDITEEVLI